MIPQDKIYCLSNREPPFATENNDYLCIFGIIPMDTTGIAYAIFKIAYIFSRVAGEFADAIK